MTTHRGHTLALRNVTQRFGDVVAARDISLDVAAGELVALLGPSGCGKTTLLRIIAGFQRQSSGSVLFDGAPVDHLPTAKRGVGIVFQNYALFPHMTVAENVAYGLEARHVPRASVESKVREMLELVRMQTFGARLPRQLSGGQQQRIALARALAVDPNVLLLDEPFGALDKNLRLDMQIEVKRLQREFGITTILVTHDQEEAMSMADRIAVLNQGNVEQCAPPVTIYDAPATLFVNQFVGTANLVPVDVLRVAGDGVVVGLAGTEILAPGGADTSIIAGGQALWAIRPERLRFASQASPRGIPAQVRVAMPMGPLTVYEVESGAARIKVTEAREAATRVFRPGDTVRIEPADERAGRIFPAA